MPRIDPSRQVSMSAARAASPALTESQHIKKRCSKPQTNYVFSKGIQKYMQKNKTNPLYIPLAWLGFGLAWARAQARARLGLAWARLGPRPGPSARAIVTSYCFWIASNCFWNASNCFHKDKIASTKIK